MMSVWLREDWLLAANVPDYPAEAKKLRRLLQFHPTSLVLGLALIGLAIAYKKFVSHSPGFPGYFTLLVAGGNVPAVHFFPSSRPVINLAALLVALFLIFVLRLFWGAALALPFARWGC